MPVSRITADQAEALLTAVVSPPHLADVAVVLDALAEGPRVAESRIEVIVADTAAVAATAAAELAAGDARHNPHPVPARLRSLRHRLAALAASVTLLVGGGAGAAVAADGSAPGDVLYGLDRALEALGIRNGGAAERLAEVEHLVLEGDAPRGLDHAAEMIRSVVPAPHTDGQAAVAALQSAAERLRAARAAGTAADDDEVSELLEYLAGHVGSVDGGTVAELSHRIGRNGWGPEEGLPAPPPHAGRR